MNPFIDIQLSVQGTVVTVQYKIDPSFKGVQPYTFLLSAYEDETFTTPLYSVPGTGFYITDDTSIRQNQLPGFFYKLGLTTSDSKTYNSKFFGWHANDNITKHNYLLANEMSRREMVRFNYTGMFAYVVKRKSYGPELANQVDSVTGEPLYDNNITFGVGAMGGYYDPILTRLGIEERQVDTDYDQAGKGSQFVEQLMVRSTGFPFIDQHDLIVTRDGKRYTVVKADNKYFPGTTMIFLQLSTLRLIPNTDTIYSIVIPNFPDEHE
jgi:hypothetical protein